MSFSFSHPYIINPEFETYSNCAILVGYELKLSRLLKQGADIWLYNPGNSPGTIKTSTSLATFN
jgi:starch phosphorylase